MNISICAPRFLSGQPSGKKKEEIYQNKKNNLLKPESNLLKLEKFMELFNSYRKVPLKQEVLFRDYCETGVFSKEQILKIAYECKYDLIIALLIITKLGDEVNVEIFKELFRLESTIYPKKAFFIVCTKNQQLKIVHEWKITDPELAILMITKLKDEVHVETLKKLFKLCKSTEDQKAFLEACTESQKESIKTV